MCPRRGDLSGTTVESGPRVSPGLRRGMEKTVRGSSTADPGLDAVRGSARRVQSWCGVRLRVLVHASRQDVPRSTGSSRAPEGARGACLQPALVVGSRDHQSVPAARSPDLGSVGAQPRAHAGEHRAGAAPGIGAGRRLPRAPGRGGRRTARLRRELPHLVPEAIRPAVASARRVFLAGVRPDRVPADLLGRARHPRGRPPQVRQRAGRAAGRRGLAVPEGLFPPVSDVGRLAAGAPPLQRFLGDAAASVLRGRRDAGAGPRRAGRPHAAAASLARSGRPRHAGAARRQHPREPSRSAGHHRRAVRRRQRDADSPGDRARRGRHPRAASRSASDPASST